MVASHHRPIASPCYRIIIIAFSRHPITVIAPSLHRHLIVASLHYRLQPWWYDGTMVSYMVLSTFHSFVWALPFLKKSYFKGWIYFNIEKKCQVFLVTVIIQWFTTSNWRLNIFLIIFSHNKNIYTIYLIIHKIRITTIFDFYLKLSHQLAFLLETHQ